MVVFFIFFRNSAFESPFLLSGGEMCKYYPWLHFLTLRASLLVDVIVIHLCEILLEPDPESEYEPHATQLPPT